MNRYQQFYLEIQKHAKYLEDELKTVRTREDALQKELDKIKEVEAALKGVPNNGFPERQNKQEPKFLKENAVRLLRLIETEKTVKGILEGLGKEETRKNEATMYALLSYYRKRFGFVESPRRGTYKLTDVGRRYLYEKHPLVGED